MNVTELRECIEARFPVGQPTSAARAVTGESYVVVGRQWPKTPKVHGIVEEGESRELALDEETACYQALSAFEDYAEGKAGTLYWRHPPDLCWENEAEKSGRCFIVMRCLISDKPQLPQFRWERWLSPEQFRQLEKC
jgi:hypothetical protein